MWKVGDFAQETRVIASGHARLDEELPGGGWPLGVMVEVLQHEPSRHAWQLVLPALAQAVKQSAGPVVLVSPPHVPFGPSLQAQGLPAQRLLCVKAAKPSSRLWACEQALKCADVAAVMAWLPGARPADLRRVQMAAQQQGRLLFVFREAGVLNDASPARLRMLVEDVPGLSVKIVKRRGPPLERGLALDAHPARLAALLKLRQSRSQPLLPHVPGLMPAPGKPHVLDRAEAHS